MRKATMLIAAVAIAVGTLVVPVAPAHAFDRGTCESYYGVGNVGKVHRFRIDTGSSGWTDFGDHSHSWGVPQGTAVVCWATDGRVFLKGYVFGDSTSTYMATAKISFMKTGDGAYTWPFEDCGGWASYGYGYYCHANSGTNDDFDLVQIRLFKGNQRVHTYYVQR